MIILGSSRTDINTNWTNIEYLLDFCQKGIIGTK